MTDTPIDDVSREILEKLTRSGRQGIGGPSPLNSLADSCPALLALVPAALLPPDADENVRARFVIALFEYLVLETNDPRVRSVGDLLGLTDLSDGAQDRLSTVDEVKGFYDSYPARDRPQSFARYGRKMRLILAGRHHGYGMSSVKNHEVEFVEAFVRELGEVLNNRNGELDKIAFKLGTIPGASVANLRPPPPTGALPSRRAPAKRPVRVKRRAGRPQLPSPPPPSPPARPRLRLFRQFFAVLVLSLSIPVVAVLLPPTKYHALGLLDQTILRPQGWGLIAFGGFVLGVMHVAMRVDYVGEKPPDSLRYAVGTVSVALLPALAVLNPTFRIASYYDETHLARDVQAKIQSWDTIALESFDQDRVCEKPFIPESRLIPGPSSDSSDPKAPEVIGGLPRYYYLSDDEYQCRAEAGTLRTRLKAISGDLVATYPENHACCISVSGDGDLRRS